ncbi:unnamed protein product [Boreogadus saida]
MRSTLRDLFAKGANQPPKPLPPTVQWEGLEPGQKPRFPLKPRALMGCRGIAMVTHRDITMLGFTGLFL